MTSSATINQTVDELSRHFINSALRQHWIQQCWEATA